MADEDSSSKRTWKKGLQAAGRSLQSSGQDMMSSAREQEERNAVPSYKKGGRVKKTGRALVHKDEFVVPKRNAKKAARLFGRKKHGARSSGRR